MRCESFVSVQRWFSRGMSDVEFIWWEHRYCRWNMQKLCASNYLSIGISDVFYIRAFFEREINFEFNYIPTYFMINKKD